MTEIKQALHILKTISPEIQIDELTLDSKIRIQDLSLQQLYLVLDAKRFIKNAIAKL